MCSVYLLYMCVHLFVLCLTNLRFLKNFDKFAFVWCYIKQIMNVFICTVNFHSVKDGIFHCTQLSPRGMEDFIFLLMKIFLPLNSLTFIIGTFLFMLLV